MTTILAAIIAAAALAAVALWLRRSLSERDTDRLWSRLTTIAGDSARFDPVMVLDLPEPAMRWLLHAIRPGTVLARAVELRMHGTLQLRSDAAPVEMQATQVLAPPVGFVWRAHVGRGLARIRGHDRYDGAGEMRWWLLGLIPVASQAGQDVTRSAAGRLAGESVLLPSAMLRETGLVWEPVDRTTMRVRMRIREEDVSFTVRVADDGRVERVVIRRWNGDPANGPVGFLPFIAEFEGERDFGGYTIAARMRAGWSSDGEQFTPFFVAELDDAAYH